MIKKNFGNRIKELRTSKFLSLEELSRIASLDKGQLSRIEQGVFNITLETIYKLAKALDIKIKDLMDFSEDIILTPFIKWHFNRSHLIAKLIELMPKYYNSYYEPFVGSGFLFFRIKPKRAFLNELNSDLVNTYSCFNDDDKFSNLKEKLALHLKNNSEDYFYKIADLDRSKDFQKMNEVSKSARFLYLNFTSFNQVYKLNKQNLFVSNYANRLKNNYNYLDNFNNIRSYFKDSKITITNFNYEKFIIEASKNDFIFINPPYDNSLNKIGFFSYSRNKFSDTEQIKLNELVKDLSKKGVKIMLTNINTPLVLKLYKDFNITIINPNKGEDILVEELIITNYKE